jgi:hypothetical protein
MVGLLACAIALAGVSARPAASATVSFDCKSYDGFKHDELGPDDHIHGNGDPGGPTGYWTLEESTNWRSDESDHTTFENGKAGDHGHTLQQGCSAGNG